NGNLHHFEVVENREKGTFVIDELDLDLNKKDFSDFEERIDQYGKAREQRGGNRKRYNDSSSSSSSSSTDIYPTLTRTSPIGLFHYNTRVYYTNNGPVFKSTLNPQVVAVSTPLFTPIFRPALKTFVAIWP